MQDNLHQEQEAHSEGIGQTHQSVFNTFQSPVNQDVSYLEEKNFPTWAIIFIVAVVVTILAACCAISILVMTDTVGERFREGLDAVVTEFDRDAAQDFNDPWGDPLVNYFAEDVEVSLFDSIHYQLWKVDGEWKASIAGDLHSRMSFPATIEIAVPAGAHISWFGEYDSGVAGGSGVEFNSPWQWRTEGDFDIYRATVTHYQSVGIIYWLDHDPVRELSSSHMSTVRIAYTPYHDLPFLYLSVALPQNAEVFGLVQTEYWETWFTDVGPYQFDEGPDGELVAGWTIWPDVKGGVSHAREVSFYIPDDE